MAVMARISEVFMKTAGAHVVSARQARIDASRRPRSRIDDVITGRLSSAAEADDDGGWRALGGRRAARPGCSCRCCAVCSHCSQQGPWPTHATRRWRPACRARRRRSAAEQRWDGSRRRCRCGAPRRSPSRPRWTVRPGQPRGETVRRRQQQQLTNVLNAGSRAAPSFQGSLSACSRTAVSRMPALRRKPSVVRGTGTGVLRLPSPPVWPVPTSQENSRRAG